MNLTDDVKTSLKREYALCLSAIAFYKKALKGFEEKYHLTTKTFLKKFEAAQMGDEADCFEWYAFAKLLAQWRKTQSAIRSTVL